MKENLTTKPYLSKRVFYGLLMSGILIMLGACVSPASTPNAGPPLKFVYEEWAGYYPALIAQEKGFFAEEGVAVELIKSPGTDKMLAGLTTGEYDAVTSAFGDIIGLTQTTPDVRLIIVSDESAGGDALVATSDIKTIADLKGKRVGFNEGSIGELFTLITLEKEGLTLNDIIRVDTDAADIPNLLQKGDIQAGHTWEPYISEATANGNHALFTSALTPGLIPDVVAFRGQTVEERPEQVKAFVRAWFRAVDFWLANPKEGTELVAKALNTPADTISLEGMKLMTQQDNLKLFEPGTTNTSLYHTAKLYVDFYSRIGALRTAPDIDKLLDIAFLK